MILGLIRKSFVSTALVFLLSVASPHAVASAAATATNLTVSSGGKTVTSVTSGSVITLTAVVSAGSSKVTTGLVNFCDASVSYCTDIHLLGTAQLTNAGIATFSLTPPVGSHGYKAVFLGTPRGTTVDGMSTSNAVALSVNGPYPSISAISKMGGAGNYSVTTMVGGAGPVAPAGTVSLLNSSNGNSVLGTATLGAGTEGLVFLTPGPNLIYIPPYPAANDGWVLADFNGDGIVDIGVSYIGDCFFNACADSGATVLLGDGKGNFTPATKLDLGPATPGPAYGMTLTMGDFNGDGIPDLAVGFGEGTIHILLGKGDGSFTLGQSISTGGSFRAVAVADLNGDGKQDLAVANNSANFVALFLGNGDGTFTASSSAPPSTGVDPVSIAVGDFNGDNVPDMAIVCQTFINGNSTLTVLLGNGDGTFTAAASPAIGEISSTVVAGDFNGDGKLDLAVANGVGGNVNILLGNGDGTFNAAPGSPVTVSAETLGLSFITVGDFNGDGKLDLAGFDVTLVGNGDGTFTVLANNTYSYSIVAAGDMNGDGLTDLLTYALTLEMAATQSATATASGIAVTPGSNSQQVVASYPGNSNFLASNSGTLSLDAAAAIPTVTLTASPNPAVQGASVTLTAAVTASGFEPTGTVTFYNGSAPLGTGTLNISGVATYTGSSLAVGSNSITASYGGDKYNNAANSSPITVTVTGAPVSVAIPAPPAVAAGSSATAIATFTAGSNYAGTINLACVLTASPVGAQRLPACSLAPTSLTLKAGGTGTSVITVTTAAASSTASFIQHSRKSLWGHGGGGTVLAVLLMCGLPARCRRWMSMLALLCVVMTSVVIGCGGGGGTKGTTTPATTAGSYTFTVTGTDSANAAITTATTVKVTVN